jgi:hypothetical protein
MGSVTNCLKGLSQVHALLTYLQCWLHLHQPSSSCSAGRQPSEHNKLMQQFTAIATVSSVVSPSGNASYGYNLRM